jgi:hypothetical protein
MLKIIATDRNEAVLRILKTFENGATNRKEEASGIHKTHEAGVFFTKLHKNV